MSDTPINYNQIIIVCISLFIAFIESLSFRALNKLEKKDSQIEGKCETLNNECSNIKLKVVRIETCQETMNEKINKLENKFFKE